MKSVRAASWKRMAEHQPDALLTIGGQVRRVLVTVEYGVVSCTVFQLIICS